MATTSHDNGTKLKPCRRTYAMARLLMEEGESERSAWRLALSGKGWWRLADTPPKPTGQ